MDQINLEAWISRSEQRSGTVSAQIAAMAAATLGRPVRDGVLPPLWHWFGFPPDTQTDDLGADGHPPLGGFLPPVRLDRRMWAGGTLTFHAPLHVDEPLNRVSTIREITRKDGAAGPMVFVSVDHEISGRAGLAISERQDIVYLATPDRFTAPRKVAAPADPVVSEVVQTPPTLLFRYSALTFNAHRIHYDLPYTQQVEHYPGLVVHGPLQATLLIDAATRHRGSPPRGFRFRGIHPMFGGQVLRVLGEETETAMTLCTAATQTDGGHQGMQATATWED